MDLHRKYRPKNFEDVVGQEHPVATLQAMLAAKAVPHAILFDGPQGSGKTTLGRIVAGELGCDPDLDFHEHNAAQFRGIDDARHILDTMYFAPKADCTVYLLDEIHRATSDYQHAMLKALEEPPRHVYFILCTTEPERLITTVRDRCMRINLTRLTEKHLEILLRRTAEKEGIALTDEAATELARAAGGSARRALIELQRWAVRDAARSMNSRHERHD
jgi:DNA polymerase-3 subunit gamma/tau